MSSERHAVQPPLPIEDYARMHAVIRGALDSVEMPMSRACIFSSVAGALMLSEHYGLQARPVAGAALFGIGGASPNVLAYCKIDGGRITSSADGFHSWVECDGWVIDFTAPRFGDAIGRSDVPARMFQRPLNAMIPPGTEVQQAGQFLLLPDQARTNAVVTSVMENPVAIDLVHACIKWYRRPPVAISEQVLVRIEGGRPRMLKLAPTLILDSW